MQILLIEDEPNIAAFVQKGLKEAGYQVRIAYDGDFGLEILKQYPIDLIILDVILPGTDGFKLCETIRAQYRDELPILMLTALGTTDQIVKGLDLGANDYLTKPFKFKELLARVRALLRRKHAQIPATSVYTFQDLELDLNQKQARRAGKEIKLTATEYRLLEYFMRNQRKVLSRIDLLENVWGVHFDTGTNVVDVYVNYLRKKIDKGFPSKLLHTVIGMGYILREDT